MQTLSRRESRGKKYGVLKVQYWDRHWLGEHYPAGISPLVLELRVSLYHYLGRSSAACSKVVLAKPVAAKVSVPQDTALTAAALWKHTRCLATPVPSSLLFSDRSKLSPRPVYCVSPSRTSGYSSTGFHAGMASPPPSPHPKTGEG